ncbi:hypothetical protein GOBAR_AA21090 [Gossypium barbadense]|uniref:Sucrose-phosphate synthase n=1 Tax=Gossypium barbadense TaxID=3634 RepID=A0A2P5X8B3_GOSBA|nr:hypothetical protein GOBAR_AA21090 [Gossypium barbadense]
MAGNDWINSYLEAILDVGPNLDDAKSSLLLRERGRFSPTRYFVEEVITGFDETDLHRSWVKAQATRSPQERNTRLENMCWRIWNLARQKKQLESQLAQRKAKRRLERERGRREATADMSEDLSEGEKGDIVSDVSAHGETHKGRLPRINSVDAMETWASQQKGKKLYIFPCSLHGLIRGENMELGRDSDTGGQVKYVVELARALGSMPGVYRVDLLTRQVASLDVDWSYGEPTEMLTPRNSEDFMDEIGESSGAYIVRIPFGPKDKYIPKELLWPHIPEFVDGALSHIIQMSHVLGEQIGSGKPVWPVAIHGHYADAGNSAALLSGALNVPMLFTGHSLGRDKLEQLLKQGRLSKDEINTTYKIMRRIEAEELSLDASEIVITSTRQEIDEQWRLYDGFDPVLERKLRARIRRNVSCYGRFMPRMVIIPPGMEFHHIVPQDGDMDGEVEGNEEHPSSPDPPIWSEIMRFFSNPRKPMILALARPDPKKNITTLVKAFGECRPLRELANLTLIMGNRDGIDEMSSTNASVLLSVLKLIDKYDLYGQVAYPKHHKQFEVPDIYRLAAKTKGVFINPAFIEPFGLTLIEAAAHGLPIVATKNGGPVDIHRVPPVKELRKLLRIQALRCNVIYCRNGTRINVIPVLASRSQALSQHSSDISRLHEHRRSRILGEFTQKLRNIKARPPFKILSKLRSPTVLSPAPGRDVLDNGLLVDPHDQQSIADALLKLVADKHLWARCRQNGLKNIHLFSWPEHCKTYLSRIASCKPRHPQWQRSDDGGESSETDSPSDSLRDIHDISLNLKFSMDGDRSGASGNDNTLDSEGNDRKSKLENAVLSWSKGVLKDQRKAGSGDRIDHGSSTGKFPALRRRKHIFVIAVDSDSNEDLLDAIRKVFEAVEKERIEGSIGFILSTYMTISEIQSFLVSGGLNANDFDAFICNSGSDLFYSTINPEDGPFVIDFYYHSHIEYRWGGEGLRKTLVRWAGSVTDKMEGNEEHIVTVAEHLSTNYCYTFEVKNAGRYLYVRWGIDLSKMVVFVGDSGDTDYEGLLGGVHKSIILKGICCNTSNQLLANRNYPLSDVMPVDSPNILQTSQDCTSTDVRESLENLLKS